jgi:hypothetical protein
LGLVGYRDDSDIRAAGFGYSGRLGYELVSGGVAIIPYIAFLSTIGGASFELEGFGEVGEFDINNLQLGLAVGIP